MLQIDFKNKTKQTNSQLHIEWEKTKLISSKIKNKTREYTLTTFIDYIK